ncbi:DNA-binding protein [Streptomyces yunnanensis]|uniref:DNA-binding protein n=1 Tax=Streptomyces yunnanensis TaxID=156453 RepID=A0ABY8A6N4_9ACTN|nr:DNA-binding protein [Streptomyces yunnanensis]WEB39416.1 DNA-binding protein [Streptomyces yunnanensis]
MINSGGGRCRAAVPELETAVPSPFLHTTPVDPATTASPRLAAVHAQLAGHFGPAGIPAEFRLLFGVPDLLCATWVAVRESLLTGSAARTDKELVAAGVARARRCPPVLRTHARALHAAGHRTLARTVRDGGAPKDPDHARLLAWGAATGAPDAPPAGPPGPPDHAPELLGTALTAHFLTRLGSALLSARADRAAERWPHRLLGGGGAARPTPAHAPRPGESLPLLADPIGPEPAWAGGAPLGAGIAALRSAAVADRDPWLSDAVRTRVRTVVAAHGGHPSDTGLTNRQPAARSWLYAALEGLRGADRPAVAVALLVALEPSQLTAADVEFWRLTAPDGAADDTALLRLAGFGAYTAVERVERSLAGAALGAGTHSRT